MHSDKTIVDQGRTLCWLPKHQLLLTGVLAENEPFSAITFPVAAFENPTVGLGSHRSTVPVWKSVHLAPSCQVPATC